MRSFQQYAIAANHDVALDSLINIESITAPGDTRPFCAPQAIWSGTPGAAHVRLDSLGHRSGFPGVGWLFSVQTRLQYDYARTTWTPASAGDGYSGYVTVYTTLGGLTYARYNATLFIPAMAETPDSRWFAPKQVLWTLAHLVQLT